MKPILFNTAMVQAILDGTKTTTRRALKVDKNLDFIGFGVEPKEIENTATFGHGSFEDIVNCKVEKHIKAPYMPGDILYVRETWKQYEKRIGRGNQCHLEKFYGYKADENNPKNPSEFYEGNWKPSIHMPKEAARIFLKVTDVRVERLDDITADGIIHEGIKSDFDYICHNQLLSSFKRLWDSTVNKKDLNKYGWDANPWVWVIEFERCDKPNEG